MKWVPYCAVHAGDVLLRDIGMYCVGGLEIDATRLLQHEESARRKRVRRVAPPAVALAARAPSPYLNATTFASA